MKLLTTAQVAERLGVHRSRVHHLIKTGRIPAEKYGVVWLVKESDVKYKRRKAGRPKKQVQPEPEPRAEAA